MIRHVVFFSASRPENVASIKDGLSRLSAIPHHEKFEVSFNRKTDPFSDAVDVVVYGEFADDAALAAYRAHPIYKETIRIVKPLRELRLSADFVATQNNTL